MKAVRPVASRLGLRSGTARRSRPLSKRNATARAVEGSLGGFCVCGYEAHHHLPVDGRIVAGDVPRQS